MEMNLNLVYRQSINFKCTIDYYIAFNYKVKRFFNNNSWNSSGLIKKYIDLNNKIITYFLIFSINRIIIRVLMFIKI